MGEGAGPGTGTDGEEGVEGGRRRRRTVNYVELNNQMFGMHEAYDGEVTEDEDFELELRKEKKKKKVRGKGGGLVLLFRLVYIMLVK